MKVEEILSSKGVHVVTIEPEQSLKEAVVLLVQHDIGALAVVDPGGRVVGVISERDIIREISRHGGNLLSPVRDVMTREVVSASSQDDLKAAMGMMSTKRFRHLPVIDHGRLKGILSIRDLVEAQLSVYERELSALQGQH